MKNAISTVLTTTLLAAPAFAETTGVEYSGTQLTWSQLGGDGGHAHSLDLDTDVSYFFSAPFGVQAGYSRLKRQLPSGDIPSINSANFMMLYQATDHVRLGFGLSREWGEGYDVNFVDLAARYSYGPWQFDALLAKQTDRDNAGTLQHLGVVYRFGRDSYAEAAYVKLEDVKGFKARVMADITPEIEIDGRFLSIDGDDVALRDISVTGYYKLSRDWKLALRLGSQEVSDTTKITGVDLAAKYYYTDQIAFFASAGRVKFNSTDNSANRIQFGITLDLGNETDLMPTTREFSNDLYQQLTLGSRPF